LKEIAKEKMVKKNVHVKDRSGVMSREELKRHRKQRERRREKVIRGV
jgi:hypothetical protein